MLSTATSLAVGLLVAVTLTVGEVPKAPVTVTPMALVDTVFGVTGGSDAAAEDPAADELLVADDADDEGDAVALFFDELHATTDELASKTATPASRLRRVSS